MKRALFLSMLFAAVAVTTSTKANLIVNGDFETGVAAPWVTTNLDPQFSGVFDSSVLGIPPHGGTYFASLSNYSYQIDADAVPGFAEFSQTVATTAGQTYDLNFWTFIQGGAGASGIEFKAMWDNNTLLDIVNPMGEITPWVNHDFTVTGTGSDTVAFFGVNDFQNSGLDDVSLTATPLPGNLTLCGIAAALGRSVPAVQVPVIVPVVPVVG